MPIGTHLDNPSTSADALLGGNYNGPTIGPAPQIGVLNPQGLGPSAQGQGWFATALKNFFANAPGAQEQPMQMYNALNQPIQGYEQHSTFNGKDEVTYNPIAYDFSGNRYTWDAKSGKYTRDATGVFSQSSQAPTRAQANPWVGADLTNPPPALSWEHLHAMYPGKSFQFIQQKMGEMGYVWNPNTSGKGNKEFAGSFIPASLAPKTNKGSGSSFGSMLEPGQRARGEDGNFYVGGTPTSEGQSQYAVTISQNLNKKMEEKGDYKWASKTVKDSEGNWVKVYWKEVRPVGQGKKQQGFYEGGGGGSQGGGYASAKDYINRNQLVTLRANYG